MMRSRHRERTAPLKKLVGPECAGRRAELSVHSLEAGRAVSISKVSQPAQAAGTMIAVTALLKMAGR